MGEISEEAAAAWRQTPAFKEMQEAFDNAGGCHACYYANQFIAKIALEADNLDLELEAQLALDEAVDAISFDTWIEQAGGEI